MKLHRKTPCDHCRHDRILAFFKKVFIFKNRPETEYKEICAACGNLLYGYIKPDLKRQDNEMWDMWKRNKETQIIKTNIFPKGMWKLF